MSFDRRQFLTVAGSAVAALGTAGSRVGFGAEPYSDRIVTDAWILEWMTTPHAATAELHIGRFADAMYFLRKPIGWVPNPGQPYQAVEVPIGFVTDFASIPRVFWTALPKDGLYTYPAIVHDFNYWMQARTREEADNILKFGMEDFKVGTVTNEAIYRGVRLGGGVAWKDNAALKSSGEKRILAKFPTSPTITWEEWKKMPGVFRD